MMMKRLLLVFSCVALAAAVCVPPTDTNGGTGDGDVHYTTLDGRYFDFQGIGKYVFARVDGELEVQACLQPWDVFPGEISTVSVNKHIAVKVGTAVVIINGTGYFMEGTWSVLSNVTVDNAFTTVVFLAGSVTFSVQSTAGGYTQFQEFSVIITFPSGAALRVNVYDSFINMGFTPASTHVGRTKGLIGLFDCDQQNDFTRRDGSVVFDVDPFATNWKVLTTEDLFPSSISCPDVIATHDLNSTVFSGAPIEFVEQADACCAEQGVPQNNGETFNAKLTRCRFDAAVGFQQQARTLALTTVNEVVNEGNSCPEGDIAHQVENLDTSCPDDCGNRGLCDPLSNSCDCLGFWTGSACEIPPACNCPSGFICQPASGLCILDVAEPPSASASFVGSTSCQGLGPISVSAPTKFGCCFLSYISEIGCVQECPAGVAPTHQICYQSTCVQGCLSSNSPVKYLQLCENCPDVVSTLITETPIV